MTSLPLVCVPKIEALLADSTKHQNEIIQASAPHAAHYFIVLAHQNRANMSFLNTLAQVMNIQEEQKNAILHVFCKEQATTREVELVVLELIHFAQYMPNQSKLWREFWDMWNTVVEMKIQIAECIDSVMLAITQVPCSIAVELVESFAPAGSNDIQMIMDATTMQGKRHALWRVIVACSDDDIDKRKVLIPLIEALTPFLNDSILISEELDFVLPLLAARYAAWQKKRATETQEIITMYKSYIEKNEKQPKWWPLHIDALGCCYVVQPSSQVLDMILNLYKAHGTNEECMGSNWIFSLPLDVISKNKDKFLFLRACFEACIVTNPTIDHDTVLSQIYSGMTHDYREPFFKLLHQALQNNIGVNGILYHVATNWITEDAINDDLIVKYIDPLINYEMIANHDVRKFVIAHARKRGHIYHNRLMDYLRLFESDEVLPYLLLYWCQPSEEAINFVINNCKPGRDSKFYIHAICPNYEPPSLFQITDHMACISHYYGYFNPPCVAHAMLRALTVQVLRGAMYDSDSEAHYIMSWLGRPYEWPICKDLAHECSIAMQRFEEKTMPSELRQSIRTTYNNMNKIWYISRFTPKITRIHFCDVTFE